jgi:hypothetical protein
LVDTTKAKRVETVLRDALADQPEIAYLAARCRAVLSSVLGASFADHRSEVDLLAVAVEEEVPQALSRGEPVELVAERFAAARDLAADDVDWAVSVWSFALAAAETDRPLALPEQPPEWPTVQHVDTLELYAMRMAMARRVVAVALVAIAIWAGWVVFLRNSHSGGTAAISTEPGVSLRFPLETTGEGLTVQRTWVLRGDKGTEFEGRLEFDNPTREPVTDVYDEVITKELASTSSHVLDLKTTGEVTTRWVQIDPVLRVRVTLAPGGRATVSFRMLTAADGLRRERLDQWRLGWRDAVLDWRGSSTTTVPTTTATTTTPTTVPSTTAAPTTPGTTAPNTTPTAPPPTAPPPTAPPVAMTAVPNVVGASESAARAQLAAAGLGVSVATQCGNVLPPGTVVAQSPGGGASVPRGSTVTITVESC